MLIKEYHDDKIFTWWRNKQNDEMKTFYEDVNIKLSGIVDLKIKLNIDASWTYGKLKNRIQFLTGIN
jgi:hypothetical protein